MGKWLVSIGAVLILAGLIWLLLERFGLQRLPGDFSFERGRFSFYFPLASSIVISIVLTVLLNIVFRMMR